MYRRYIDLIIDELDRDENSKFYRYTIISH